MTEVADPYRRVPPDLGALVREHRTRRLTVFAQIAGGLLMAIVFGTLCWSSVEPANGDRNWLILIVYGVVALAGLGVAWSGLRGWSQGIRLHQFGAVFVRGGVSETVLFSEIEKVVERVHKRLKVTMGVPMPAGEDYFYKVICRDGRVMEFDSRTMNSGKSAGYYITSKWRGSQNPAESEVGGDWPVGDE